MHTAYLLLGSNQGNSLELLSRANQLLGEFQQPEAFLPPAILILKSSSIYNSKAWGFESEDIFYNQVLKIETSLDPKALLHACLEIEKKLGRQRKTSPGYCSRLIDIDILFYDELILESPELIIPHPKLHLRGFTLLPLAEIDAKLWHPLLNKSIEDLCLDCPDDLEMVTRLD